MFLWTSCGSDQISRSKIWKFYCQLSGPKHQGNGERENEKKRLHDNIYNIQFHGPTNATLFSTLILHSSFFALFTATKQRVGLWELNSDIPYSD